MDINNVDLKSRLEITVSRSQGATPQFWELNITGRYLEKRREKARARSTGLVAMHVTPALIAVDFTDSFVGSEKLLAWRGGVDFPKLSRR